MLGGRWCDTARQKSKGGLPTSKSLRLCVAAGLAVAIAISGVAQFTASSPARAAIATNQATPAEYYLALGDSAPMWNGDHSYPDVILRHERKDVPALVLDNFACSGETTASFIAGSCAPGGSQLNEAISFLREHRHHVGLVTIDIGGNDIVGCAVAPINASCISAALKTIKKNLTKIMTALRAAAGGTTLVVGMNYYDPLLGDWLARGKPRSLAIATSKVLVTLNKLLGGIYLKVAGATTANVQQSFQSTNFTKRVSSKWGRIPVAVARACGWLDITCQRGMSEGFGDDPNDYGAIVIAGAFVKVIGKLSASSS
jgi:lysophospholipase L1-like esterase